MKKSLILILLVSLAFMTACSMDDTKDDLGVDDNSSDQIWVDVVDTIDDEGSLDTSYDLSFDGESSQIIEVHHNTEYSTYVYFDNDDFENMHIEIEFLDSEPHNFRLNTVTNPSWDTDGPFWVERDIELDESWRYVFEFGESLMQWDHWTGDANIIFSVE